LLILYPFFPLSTPFLSIVSEFQDDLTGCFMRLAEEMIFLKKDSGQAGMTKETF
jgi:hypothetical protein